MLLEKAKRYAENCISGKEITTFEVKKQCEWFLGDLEKQNNDYYPYYFDTKQIVIIEGILKLLNFATGPLVFKTNFSFGSPPIERNDVVTLSIEKTFA